MNNNNNNNNHIYNNKGNVTIGGFTYKWPRKATIKLTERFAEEYGLFNHPIATECIIEHFKVFTEVKTYDQKWNCLKRLGDLRIRSLEDLKEQNTVVRNYEACPYYNDLMALIGEFKNTWPKDAYPKKDLADLNICVTPLGLMWILSRSKEVIS